MSETKPSLPADLLKDILADLSPAEKELAEKMQLRLLGIALDVMEPPKPKPERKVVESIADMQSAVDALFDATINFHGRDFVIKGRRLRPKETADILEILARSMPPVLRGERDKPQTDRYNYDDPAYIKAKRDAQITARALGLYWAYPAIEKGKPNLKNPKDIVDYIQGTETTAGLWNSDILESLWTLIQDGGVRKAEATNFI